MAIATEAMSPAAPFLGQRKRMLIEGEWVEARHGRTLEVYDPALGDVIDHVPAGDAEDIDEIENRMGTTTRRCTPLLHNFDSQSGQTGTQ